MYFVVYSQQLDSFRILFINEIDLYEKYCILRGYDRGVFNVWIRGNKHHNSEFGTLLAQRVSLREAINIMKTYKG